MARKVKLAEMTWVEVKAALESGTDTVIVPLGSVEQHSCHLPLITDSANVEWIAVKAAEGTDGVLVAPTVVYGISHNHIDFAGTVTLRTSTLIALLKDIAHSLVKHGFRNIVFLNGHGGNNATVAVAAIELREETGATIANIYTPNLMRNSAKVLESDIEWHADEGETSTALVAIPELVDMSKAVKEIPKPRPLFTFTEEALSRSVVDLGLPKTREITTSGTIGDATLATREKGERMMGEAVETLVGVIAELREAAREAARASNPS